jgi:hypothetical protein
MIKPEQSHSGMRTKRRIINNDSIRTKSEKGRVIISRATRHQSIKGARGAKGETREGITTGESASLLTMFHWIPIIQQEKR